MLVTATAKNVRISPEKVRLVVAQIKNMPPDKAVEILNFINKSASPVIKKVIQSAIANARNNFGLSQQSLVFKQILVGPGPAFKRYRAVARGRAHAILKRTSHIKVILEGEKTKEASKSQIEKEAEKQEVKKNE